MNVSSPIPHKKARIEIIPLIDIMFFLLASFMMVSLSQTTMKGMKVNLPIGSSGQTQSKKDYVSLSVDKDGYYYFDKTRIALEEILPKLKQVYATAPEAKIFIRADRDSLHGNVTRMLDQIRSSGFQKLSFEIKSEATQGIPGGPQEFMPGPLLYRPAPRWQAISAFAGAIFIHLAAVGIASIHPKEPPPQDLSSLPEA